MKINDWVTELHGHMFSTGGESINTFYCCVHIYRHAYEPC